jgi:MYXO-CTERM domain-containing protein
MRWEYVLFGALSAILIAIAPTHARAFIRSTVDGDPSTPLFWRYRTVVMRPAYDTSADVPADAVHLAIDRAIGAWNTAGEGCSDFRFEDGGYPSGLETNGYGAERDGENRIVWHEDEWPEDLHGGTLAVTTTLYRVSTGQILDADIDVNGVDYFWTDTTDPGAVDTDVQNALTHELGHVLGLAHVSDPDATMYAESAPGDLEKRSLAQDDIDGLCFVYPDRVLTPDAPPFHGHALTGCSAAPARDGAPAWILVAGALALRRRRSTKGGLRDE